MKKDIVRNIVSYGNLPIVPGGQPLFTRVGSGRSARLIYGVRPGQLIAYKVENGVATTIDTATLTSSSDLDELFIGVGIDTNGGGLANDIRYLGTEHIAACSPKEISTSSPKCGSPQVVDFYFDCTECNETYSAMVKVDDNFTRSYAPWNKSSQEFVGSIVTNCSSCNDCAPEHNCKEVACKLSDALNNELNLRVGDGGYPDWKGLGMPRPFFVTRLHGNSFTYCLSPESTEGACDSCTHMQAITGANINGQVFDFVGTTSPGNGEQTLVAQLDSVVAQLNAAFITAYAQGQEGVNPHAGSAYLTGTYQKCCPAQLHVNTCDAEFQLLTVLGEPVGEEPAVRGVITPTSETNPLVEHGTTNSQLNCIDCDESPVTSSLPCGIRVIAEQIKGNCECFIEQPLAFYGRKIEVGPIGEGFRGKPYKVTTVQDMELPAGFGSWIQWLELQDLPEGRGRRFSRSNDTRGWMGLPDSKSRVRKAVTADCEKNYCSYYLQTVAPKRNLNGTSGEIIVNSHVHIPSTDTVTKDAFEAFLAKMLTLSVGCKLLTPIECDTALGACV